MGISSGVGVVGLGVVWCGVVARISSTILVSIGILPNSETSGGLLPHNLPPPRRLRPCMGTGVRFGGFVIANKWLLFFSATSSKALNWVSIIAYEGC